LIVLERVITSIDRAISAGIAVRMKIDGVPQVDKNPHGSSHRWPLIAETRELASAINSASHAASTVGRKGDCKGSLVTEHCVTQVYILLLPGYYQLAIRFRVTWRIYKDIPLPVRRTTDSFVLFASVATLRGIIKGRLLYAWLLHALTFLLQEFNSAQQLLLILICWIRTSF